MVKKQKRKNEERKKKEREQEKQYQFQKLIERRKYRSLHDKHKNRRKKDCMIGLPFILAFQGDPTRLFYCADIPDSYELIPRTERYPKTLASFHRLTTYLHHHVTQIHAKVLIYKAP